MSTYEGYPPVECQECGASDTRVAKPVHAARQFGPGEWAWYYCRDCEHTFDAIVPEPSDGYQGDGVFAENH